MIPALCYDMSCFSGMYLYMNSVNLVAMFVFEPPPPRRTPKSHTVFIHQAFLQPLQVRFVELVLRVLSLAFSHMSLTVISYLGLSVAFSLSLPPSLALSVSLSR